MPIRPGLVECLETRTYKGRLKAISEIFTNLRAASRESRIAVPLSDIVDRIRTIYSVFIAVVEPDKLLLCVSFDQPWEPYIRSIQDDLGNLLDTILVNCDGYEEHHRSELGYDAFARWVRNHQINTDTFYLANGRTTDDARRLEQLEQIYRRGRSDDAYIAATHVTTPPAATAAVTRRRMLTSHAETAELVTLGLKAATALHAMTALYPKETDHHKYLHRAASDVLSEFVQADILNRIPPLLQHNFATEIAWIKSLPPARNFPNVVGTPPGARELQGGIINRVDANLGCLVFLRVIDAAEARRTILTWVRAEGLQATPSQPLRIARADTPDDASSPHMSLALTLGGMRALELPSDVLDAFPKEFRDGMAARAGAIGDLRENHPDQWQLPERNWPVGVKGTDQPRISLDIVDVVVQLRIIDTGFPEGAPFDATHPLHASIVQLQTDAGAGLRILGVQEMYSRPEGREHFGYKDGLSQPAYSLDAGPGTSSLGGLLLGQADCPTDIRPAPHKPPNDWLLDGTFLVVRKQVQHVERFHAQVAEAAQQSGTSADEVRAKVMGRTTDGVLLSAPGTIGVAGDYGSDPHGFYAPLQSHVRRTNPGGAKTPRILRRGMSFGPPAHLGNAPRGLIFQAYCASICEQYEVIQRWISGGNPTGQLSLENDPLLGLPQPGQSRTMLLPGVAGNVRRIDLGSAPFVTLSWGMYLFMPSIRVLKRIAALKPAPRATSGANHGQLLLRAARRIADRRERGMHIKALLEDKDAIDDGYRAAIWAHVRERGGAVRLPEVVITPVHESGRDVVQRPVLVGTRDLVQQVLGISAPYSAREYQRRLGASSGEIYLGMDRGAAYDREAVINEPLSQVTMRGAFDLAYKGSVGLLEQLKSVRPPIDLPLPKYLDAALALVTQRWFGIKVPGQTPPTDGIDGITLGGEPPQVRSAAHCPFHFTSPSRYVFSPWPTKFVEDTAIADGNMLLKLFRDYAPTRHQQPPTAPLTKIIHETYQSSVRNGAMTQQEADDLFPRSLLGILLAMLPTVQGNFLSSMEFLIKHRTLWRLQDDFLDASRAASSAATQAGALAAAQGASQAGIQAASRAAFDAAIYGAAERTALPALKSAMLARPVPSTVHRIATADASLGGEQIKVGDSLIVSLYSAAADASSTGAPDIDAIFSYKYPNTAHGCPGWNLGMGSLLGMVCGLLRSGTLLPTPSNLALLLRPAG